VQNNTMKDVLCRHFPELAGPLHNVKNVSCVSSLIRCVLLLTCMTGFCSLGQNWSDRQIHGRGDKQTGGPGCGEGLRQSLLTRCKT
jgi:hypothetical protein